MRIYLIGFFALILGACSSGPKSKSYGGHGLDSIDKKTLAEFAPPPVDSDRLRKIQSLLDVRSPSAGVLSPDNKTLFVSWNVTGSSQIWKVPGPRRFPVQMTGGEDGTRLLAVTPDGKNLVLGRDEKGNEYPGLYLQSVDGGELKTIYKKRKVQVFLGFVSDDSKTIYFRANDRNPKSYAIYKYDVATEKTELVFEGPDGWWIIADHYKEKQLLLANWRTSQAVEYFLLDLKTKTTVPLFGQGENQEYSALFGARPDELLVITDKFSEFRKLYKWKAGKFSEITKNENFNIESITTDRQKRKGVLRVNKKGYYTVLGINLKTLKTFEMLNSKDKNTLHTFSGRFSRDGNHFTYAVMKANEPTSSYVYNWRTGKSVKWTDSSSPEVNLSGGVAPTLEYYPARDGTKIPMFVQRPPQCLDKVCPVIVQFHGGPEVQAIPRFSPVRQLFLDKNYIFVEPNVRGSDGYGKTWRKADDGPKRLNVLTDIEDAGKYIKKNWARWGQSPKVAVMGGSYGGYSTFMAMTKFAGTYDAGIAIVGMSSLLTFLQNTAPYRRALRVSEYGDPETDLEALKKLSAMTYLDKLKSPMLIIHGATDPRVPAGEAIQVYREMQEKGLPGQLVLFPDEGHGIKKRRNKALYLGYVFDFLDKNMQQ